MRIMLKLQVEYENLVNMGNNDLQLTNEIREFQTAMI